MLEPVIQDRRGGRWWLREDVLLLILVGALLFLPGLGQIPLFDRDEPRFATAAREMMASGDYLVPRFNGELRPDKPPLIYWLMSASYWVAGQANELSARLPSAICGTLTLIVVYFMVGVRLGRLTGLLSSLILGTCSIFVVESRMATADATMLLCIVVCMACAWRAWDEARDDETQHSQPESRNGADAPGARRKSRRRGVSWRVAMSFWVALAAGVMTKGVPLFFVLVPMVVLSLATGSLPDQLRRWRSHLHVTAVRIVLAVIVGLAVILVVAGALKGILPEEARWWGAVVGALVVGMVLSPGLPGVLFHCLAGGNWRWWRGLRPMVGVPLLAALVGWWVIAAWYGTDPHGVLVERMVGLHFLARVAGPLLKAFHLHIVDLPGPGGADPMGSYGKPPGFYLLLVWVTFWPWSILLVPAAYHAVRRVIGRSAIAIDRGPYQFLLAWVLPMWVLLELARGKLLHYPLPIYVGIAILCADALVQGWERLTEVFSAKWFAGARWVMLLIWMGLGVAVLIGAKMSSDDELFLRCIPLAGALVAAGVATTIAWGRASWPFVSALGWAAVLLVVNTLVLPEMSSLQVSRMIGQRMAELKRADRAVILAAVGYEEPTLVFYSGQKVEMGERASKLLTDGTSKYVAAVDEKTVEKLKKLGADFRVVMERRGMNAANQKPVRVMVITNVPAKEGTTQPATQPEISQRAGG